MNGLYRIILLVVGLTLINGCREVFYPDIEPVHPLVAVEGLITDGPGPHRIKLSQTSDYYSGSFGEPLEHASVSVRVNDGESHAFTEIRPGLYQSHESFSGQPGNTYTLEFETPDGDVYRSTPQLMYPAFTPGTLQAREAVRTTTRESNSGQLVITEKEGVEAFLQILDHADNQANIRFKTNVKVFYMSETFSAAGPQRQYCWREFRRFEGLENFNLPTTGRQPGDVSNNLVAFLPDDQEEYFVDELDYLHALAVQISTFSLNEDAYNYYHDVYKQLTSDGTIFAPIPSQLSTNIFCVSDPGRAAVGLFETSAIGTGAYILKRPPMVEATLFVPTDIYDDVPSVPGCYLDETPRFWPN